MIEHFSHGFLTLAGAAAISMTGSALIAVVVVGRGLLVIGLGRYGLVYAVVTEPPPAVEPEDRGLV